MKNKDEIEVEKKENAAFEALSKFQTAIKNKYSYLETVQDKMFMYEFVKAQAEEICTYLTILKFTPFKALEAMIKKTLEDDVQDYKYQLFIKQNEFGEYIPDTERLKGLILEEPDQEEFPSSRNY